MTFTCLPFHLLHDNSVFCNALVSHVHNGLRLVLVDRKVILRFVLRKRCDSFRIRGPCNVRVSIYKCIFCVVLWVFGVSCNVLRGIPVLSFASNDDRWKSLVIAMCSILFYSFCLFLGYLRLIWIILSPVISS